MTQTDKLELAANTRRVGLRGTVGKVPGHCRGRGGVGGRVVAGFPGGGLGEGKAGVRRGLGGGSA